MSDSDSNGKFFEYLGSTESDTLVELTNLKIEATNTEK